MRWREAGRQKRGRAGEEALPTSFSASRYRPVAYGWPADLPDEEILARLLALNLERDLKAPGK